MLTDNDQLMTDVSTHPNSFDSDHLPVSLLSGLIHIDHVMSLRRFIVTEMLISTGFFRQSLQDVKWDAVLSNENTDLTLSNFQDVFFNLVNKHILLRN